MLLLLKSHSKILNISGLTNGFYILEFEFENKIIQKEGNSMKSRIFESFESIQKFTTPLKYTFRVVCGLLNGTLLGTIDVRIGVGFDLGTGFHAL